MSWLISTLFGKKCEFCSRGNYRVCPDCISKIAEFRHSQDGVPYFLNYQDEHVRKLIWKFKYKNEYIIAKDLAPLFGDFICEQIENSVEMHSKPIFIIPAPITHDPMRYRLKNHMLVMAYDVKKYLLTIGLNVNVCDCLEKTGHKRSAMTLGKKKRTEHVEKTLQLKSPAPNEGIIFIIDDVTTTGATMRKIKKLVSTKRAFAQSVALAH